MFAGFTSKVNLLKEAAETTLVGDADPVPLAERPADAPRARRRHRRARCCDRLAALIAEAARRACYPIFAVVHAAADADPEIAALARTLDEQRLAGATMLAGTVLPRLGADDPDRLAEVRDTIWTLNSPLLYGLLVVQRGWSAERYGDWIARALVALVVP